MNTKKIGAATFAVVAAAGLLAGCGNSTEGDSPVAFSPVTGDQFTANPGAFQTDGVAAPPQGVTMVGNVVAAQAVANAGLPQGTITSTVNNTTVYYPPAPAIPGLRPAPQPAPPAPMVRPANYRPWNYTPQQIEVYRQICETGTWNNYRAGIQVQTQTCWTLYGRQLGVKPWQPGQPKPWQRPDYPKPWFDASFKVDVPVFWVYPKDWTKPKPQPLISVSISLNVPNNPYRRVNPRDNVLYYPVWAVTPGRVVDARDQGRILAPVYTETTTTTTTTTTTKYVYAPTAPGVVLAPLPTSNKVELVTALPGAKVTGNVNVDAKVLVPTAAALKGAPIQAGTKASLEASVGTSVDATVDKDAKKADSKDAKTTEATKDAGANQSAKVEVGAGVSGSAGNGGVNGGAQGKAQVPGASGAASASASAGAAAPTSSAAPKTGQNRVAPTPAPAETSTQTQEAPKTTVTTPAPEATETAPTTSTAPTCTPAQIQAKTCPTTAGQ